jgi:hypothetical protein
MKVTTGEKLNYSGGGLLELLLYTFRIRSQEFFALF